MESIGYHTGRQIHACLSFADTDQSRVLDGSITRSMSQSHTSFSSSKSDAMSLRRTISNNIVGDQSTLFHLVNKSCESPPFELYLHLAVFPVQQRVLSSSGECFDDVMSHVPSHKQHFIALKSNFNVLD